MITLSIDLSKLQKERFKTLNRRDGSKGTSCDLILIPTPNGQYGDFMVKQSITKEERESGVELPILGNAKHLERGGTRSRPQPPQRQFTPKANPEKDDSGDVPF